MKKLEKILTGIVWFIFICIIGLLAILSIFKTAFIAEGETVTFNSGHWYIHIVVLAVLIFIMKIHIKIQTGKHEAGKEAETQKAHPQKLWKDGMFWAVIIVVNACISVIWILATRMYPAADQETLVNIAADMRSGVYSAWQPGGYMFLYPFQNGILLMIYAISRIFTGNTYLAAQFVNIPFCILGIIASSMCVYKLFKIKDLMRITAILMTLWLPFAMYNTFIYGTVPGFALMMSAYWIALSYFEKRDVWKIVAASLLAALSVILKSNYSIMLIALIILIAMDIIRRCNIRSIAFVIMLVVTLAAGKYTCNGITEHITGTDTPEGVPKIAWAAMGISGDYGWWDGYNIYIYGVNNYDSELAKKGSWERIDLCIEQFVKKPLSFVRFFAGKIVSEWCEPTFQSVSIQNSRSSSIEQCRFVKSFMRDEGIISHIYRFILDIFQTLVYTGTFAWLWYGRKNITFEQMILGICLIGCFLFHIVWEAKGQYTMVYFLLIIPYAVEGWRRLTLHNNNAIIKKLRQ